MGMNGACWTGFHPSCLPMLLLLWLLSWTCNYICVSARGCVRVCVRVRACVCVVCACMHMYVYVCHCLNFKLIAIYLFGFSQFYQFCVMLLLDYTFVWANNVCPSKTNIFRLIPSISLQPHNFVEGRGREGECVFKLGMNIWMDWTCWYVLFIYLFLTI
jgi:hypothetical protein